MQIHGIQDAVKEAAEAILAVDKSVAAMSHVNENVTRLMEQQIVKLDRIGTEANKVAVTVSEALPGIRAIVTDVAAGRRRRAGHRRRSDRRARSR